MLDNIAKETVKHTSNWTLSDWKVFRSLNNYWEVRDSAYSDGSAYEIREFREWKLQQIRKYNR